ncbi:MAG: 8-oxo-dGTP diphosphatase [Thermoanaerobaculia bacterium]|nr:8-oxo-dGTP diphosphatase [Thermoanaerobaculia bacterium]
MDPATLVFVRANGHLLLIRKKRGLGAGKINGPGGRIDPGESPLDCARREVEEELLVTPTGLRIAGENRFQFVDGYSIHVFIYSAAGCLGEPTETEEAVPLWTPVGALPYDEMWQDDRVWMPHLLTGRRFSGRYLFDGDRMLDYELDLA